MSIIRVDTCLLCFVTCKSCPDWEHWQATRESVILKDGGKPLPAHCVSTPTDSHCCGTFVSSSSLNQYLIMMRLCVRQAPGHQLWTEIRCKWGTHCRTISPFSHADIDQVPRGCSLLCNSDYGYERGSDGNCKPAFWFNPSTVSRSCSQGQNYFNSTG